MIMVIAMMWFQERLSRISSARGERGLVTAEAMGVAAFGLVVMAGLFLLMQSFGAALFSWLGKQTGIS